MSHPRSRSSVGHICTPEKRSKLVCIKHMHVTGSDPDTNSLPLAGFEVLGLAHGREGRTTE
jgi:hypothetical protein